MRITSWSSQAEDYKLKITTRRSKLKRDRKIDQTNLARQCRVNILVTLNWWPNRWESNWVEQKWRRFAEQFRDENKCTFNGRDSVHSACVFSGDKWVPSGRGMHRLKPQCLQAVVKTLNLESSSVCWRTICLHWRFRRTDFTRDALVRAYGTSHSRLADWSLDFFLT